MSAATVDFDTIIIGAGPAGLSLSRSLADLGLSVALIERLPAETLAEPPFDGREIALTHRSATILTALDAWHRIPPQEISPLGEARVLNGTSLHALRFSPARNHEEVLGHLVPNHLIRRALFEAVSAAPGVTLLAGCTGRGIAIEGNTARLALDDGRSVTARLIVAADTRFSDMRRQMGISARMRDFGKTMLVCRMAHDVPHETVATEWFGYGQTIALLPLNGTAEEPNVSSLVLTLPARETARLMTLEPAEFNDEITRRTLDRQGDMRLIGSRHAYPLVAVYADRFVADRFALVGDAAVGMHPVTAHGFNFGLTGQAALAKLIGQAVKSGGDIAAAPLLSRYALQHRLATRPLYLATNATALLYTDDRLPARAVRDAVIRAGEVVRPVRQAIVARLMQGSLRPRLG